MATARELRELGFSGNEIRRLLRRGVLVAPRKGVYATAKFAASVAGDAPRKHALELAVALASTGADCAGSHWTAATILGLGLLDRPPAGVVALTSPPAGAGSRARRPGVKQYVARLPAADVVDRYGVPITSAARTVVDIARTGSFQAGVVVADSALRAGLVTAAELDAMLAACGQWPGLRRGRDVIAFADARSESVLESLSRVIMHERGLEPPELQTWITDGYGARIARVDFYWQRHQTIGEADGVMKYEDPAAARRQLDRDKKLRQAGYQVVHFGWRGIVHDTDIVIGELRAAFDAGARQGG